MESRKVKPQAKRGLWKPEEDLILKNYVEIYGEGNWATVSKRTGLKRGGKSCRLRWKNYLRPNIKRGSMSEAEEDLIIRMHKLLGNRWSLIAGRLPGRTDNEVKNYWNTYLSKKLQGKRQSIDPGCHDNFDGDNDDKKDEKKLCRPGDSQFGYDASSESMSQCPEGSRKERDESSIITNPERDTGSFGLDPKCLVAAANSAAFIFEDEILTSYWDCVPFLEAFDCSGEETYPQVNFQSIFP